MKKISLFVIIAVLICSLLLAGCAQTPAPTTKPATTPAPAPTAPVQKITWKYNSNYNTGYYHYPIMQQFASELSKRSGGRFELELHPGGDLGYKPNEVLRVLRDNMCPISDMNSGSGSGELPMLSVTELPFLTRSFDDSSKVAKAINGPLTRELKAKFGTRILMHMSFDPTQIWGTKKLVTLDDIKGTKIRVYGAVPGEALEACGATPVYMPIADVYTALQRKTFECAISGYVGANSYKWQEVCTYGNDWYMAVPCALFVLASEKAISALPQDLQKILMDLSKEMEDKAWQAIPGVAKDLREKMGKDGVQYITPDPAAMNKASELGQASWKTWEKAGGATCTEVLDLALKALNRTRAY